MDAAQERPLAERMDELRQRLAYVIERLDLRAQVEQHPWEIVGAAAMLGAWLGFAPPRVKVAERRGLRARVADGLLSAVGAIAVRLVREAALRQVGEVAKKWWEETARGAPAQDTVVHVAPVV